MKIHDASPGPVASRRAFFASIARWAAAGAAAAIGAAVTARRSAPGQACVSDGRCRACAVGARCGLPQALSYRRDRDLPQQGG